MEKTEVGSGTDQDAVLDAPVARQLLIRLPAGQVRAVEERHEAVRRRIFLDDEVGRPDWEAD